MIIINYTTIIHAANITRGDSCELIRKLWYLSAGTPSGDAWVPPAWPTTVKTNASATEKRHGEGSHRQWWFLDVK